MRLKIAFCCLVTFVCFINSNAQEAKFTCDPGNYSVLKLSKGKTFTVECDTIYIVNKSTFNLMFNAYNDFRKQNLLLSQYALVSDSISNMYQTQLDTQRLYFDSLNAYFDTLNVSVNQLVKKSSDNVDSVAANLDSIEMQVKATKENISNAQHNIDEAKKLINRSKLKWGAIGFGAGLVLTLIVSVIALH
jgi:methyl-accepting chemotaxis protein